MKTSRILAFASLLILLTTLTVCAQQDETAIDQIKERISKLEAIDLLAELRLVQLTSAATHFLGAVVLQASEIRQARCSHAR